MFINDATIESIVADCIEKAKEDNNQQIADRLAELEANSNISNADEEFEILKLLMDSMYSTINYVVCQSLCEYNRNKNQ